SEGDPTATSDEVGQVYVFHSAGAGGVPSADATAASAVLSGSAEDETLGLSLAVGDLNGDGYDDVAVTANRKTVVFHSAGSAGIPSADAAPATTRSSGSGGAAAGGDIAGDGFAALIPGCCNHVSIFHSGPAGVASGTTDDATATIAGTPLTGGAV